MQAGADVTVATKRMHTAAHIAAQYGPAPLLRIVARHARKLETGPVRHCTFVFAFCLSTWWLLDMWARLTHPKHHLDLSLLVLEFNRKHKHGIRCQWVLQHLGHLAASPPVLVNRATTREIKIVYGFGAGMSRTTTAHNGKRYTVHGGFAGATPFIQYAPTA